MLVRGCDDYMTVDEMVDPTRSMNMFKKLPMWKDENPISYEKQQISNKLRRLQRNPAADPMEIKTLQERYAVLEQMRLQKNRSRESK